MDATFKRLKWLELTAFSLFTIMETLIAKRLSKIIFIHQRQKLSLKDANIKAVKMIRGRLKRTLIVCFYF
jgi:hypothetical protein